MTQCVRQADSDHCDQVPVNDAAGPGWTEKTMWPGFKIDILPRYEAELLTL